MQAIFDFLTALVVALAAAAFAQFGVTLAPKEKPHPTPEARRTDAAATSEKPALVEVKSPQESAQDVDSRRAGVDKSVHRGA